MDSYATPSISVHHHQHHLSLKSLKTDLVFVQVMKGMGEHALRPTSALSIMEAVTQQLLAPQTQVKINIMHDFIAVSSEW